MSTPRLYAAGTIPIGDRLLEVDLTVERGAVVALVGPNGAGKSATIAGILGLLPFTGYLHLMGAPANHQRPDERGLGWVPQEPGLIPRRRVSEQLSWFADPRAPLADRRSTADMLAALGLAGHTRARPNELSVGQRQRVAVGRALMASEVVLLDEPTSAQDAEGALAVRKLIREHGQAGGAAVVVAHDPADAYAIADHVVVLEDLTIAQRGTPQELAAAPATPYIARVAGATVLRGDVEDGILRGPWGELQVPDDAPVGPAVGMVPPSAVTILRTPPVTTSARNLVPSTVGAIEPTASGVVVSLRGKPDLVALLTASAALELAPKPGEHVLASVKANEIRIVRA